MSEVTEVEATKNASAVSAGGPGGLLRQARADLRLPVEEVAKLLNLSPRQIVALEQDDYEHLPGATYVRGYLRNYALLLGLAPDKVVESYNCLPDAARPVDLTKLTTAPEIGSGDRLVKFVTLMVAAIVLGLAAVWWQGRDEGIVKSAGVSKPAAPAAGPNTPAAPEAAAPAVTRPDARSVVSPKPAGPAAPRARLVLTAARESWVDIRDADGDKLLYETLPPGQVVTIEARAPLSVFLGSADGVRLEFNGSEYNVLQHKHGQVARFTLGAAGR